MEDLRVLQKQEARKRLDILEKVYNLHPNVLTEYNQDETIYYSESINKLYSGVLYWLDNKSEFVDAVKEIENKCNIFVYHCILNHTEFGDWLSMLYVSDTPDNWQDEKLELKSGTPFAYVYTFDEFSSEFGPIEIASASGGLTRLS